MEHSKARGTTRRRIAIGRGAMGHGRRAGAAIAVACVVLLSAVAMAGCRNKGRPIRVLTDRTESHVAPMFEAFTKATGVPIEAVYLDKGLVERLESRPTEADLVITKDADLLELAKGKGLLQPFASAAIEASVPAEYRDPDGLYFSDSYRARVIFYSKDRVKPSELSTYEDLGSDRWKGRLCIRSGYHDYNVSLFAQMVVAWGPERTRSFIEKLARNLARVPTGNDRAQARAIYEGQCDVALANSYYMGIMLSSPEQRAWGEATRVFFPDQDAGGSFILRSGLALTRATSNVDRARKLLEYMVQDDVQAAMSERTFAYPVLRTKPLPEPTRALGTGQPQVEDGAFQIHQVPLAAVARERDRVVRMLDEVGFDKPH